MLENGTRDALRIAIIKANIAENQVTVLPSPSTGPDLSLRHPKKTMTATPSPGLHCDAIVMGATPHGNAMCRVNALASTAYRPWYSLSCTIPRTGGRLPEAASATPCLRTKRVCDLCTIP
jgi:hypothetical protein